jgi:hypothetical protein
LLFYPPQKELKKTHRTQELMDYGKREKERWMNGDESTLT